MLIARLAPTPSGYLHWGNLYNFVLTWREVRRAGGKLALRIDDMDATRAREEYVDDIFQTLRWLGFEWELGPQDRQEFTEHYSQRHRIEQYRDWLRFWPGYACVCSRAMIQQRTSEDYDGHCRQQNNEWVAGVSAWRVLSPLPATDVILWRRDNLPAYQLVSLVEDLELGTNLVVRGEDLLSSSQIQLMLARELGPRGQDFCQAQLIHHPLLRDENGQKLSKSSGAESLRQWHILGRSPAAVFSELCRRAGISRVDNLSDFLNHPQL